MSNIFFNYFFSHLTDSSFNLIKHQDMNYPFVQQLETPENVSEYVHAAIIHKILTLWNYFVTFKSAPTWH